jgi:uncharacterized protein (DUF433 family)
MIDMAETSRIQADPRVLGGKPVIRGTRISVELLLRKLAEGATVEDLLDAYPHLTIEDVRAAVSFAADLVADEAVLTPTPPGSAKPSS